MRKWEAFLVIIAICLAVGALSVSPPEWHSRPPNRAAASSGHAQDPVATPPGVPEKAPEATIPGTSTQKPASARTTRAVTVTLLVDQALLAPAVRDATLLQISNFMASVNDIFKKEFGIEFFYSIEPWEYAPGKPDLDAHQVLATLDGEWEKRSSDLVIGLTRRGLFEEVCAVIDDVNKCQKEYHGGLAYVLDNSAIVSLNWTTHHALLHEIGHMFGATHSAALGVPSVMAASPPLADFFDEKNKAIILEHRMRVFRPTPTP